jgi:hypothetical protein
MLKKMTLTPIPDSTNLYCLSYDYKIFPELTNPNTFKFVSELPFNGLPLATNGGIVQLSVVMPLNAQIDDSTTIGTATNGTKIEEHTVNLAPINRNVVIFRYNIDPLFNIIYHY